MKRTILLYNFEGARFRAVRKALAPLGCSVKSVVKRDYGQPVGFLAGAEGITSNGTKNSSEGFSEEMMVMYGFGSEMIDVVIAALKKGGVGKIELKAVITPSNILWDSVKLYHEIKFEHDSLS